MAAPMQASSAMPQRRGLKGPLAEEGYAFRCFLVIISPFPGCVYAPLLERMCREGRWAATIGSPCAGVQREALDMRS